MTKKSLPYESRPFLLLGNPIHKARRGSPKNDKLQKSLAVVLNMVPHSRRDEYEHILRYRVGLLPYHHLPFSLEDIDDLLRVGVGMILISSPRADSRGSELEIFASDLGIHGFSDHDLLMEVRLKCLEVTHLGNNDFLHLSLLSN
jgi:hypothetical protein